MSAEEDTAREQNAWLRKEYCPNQQVWYYPTMRVSRRALAGHVDKGKAMLEKLFMRVSRMGHVDKGKAWEKLSPTTRLLILQNESTVEVGLLLENKTLVQMIKNGASEEDCLKFINENW